MSQITICIVGEDKRQDYLELYLQEQGLMVRRMEAFDPDILPGNDILVGPVTFYRDQKLLPHIEEACNKAGVTVLNYMASEEFLLRNAFLTAEGLLSIIIQNTAFSLEESNVLLLGLGRCGKAIEKMLKRFSCRLDAYDTVPGTIPLSGIYNVVINTIPAPVITREHLQRFQSGCVLFEVASAPGGFDKAAAEELNLSLVSCPGIPGKYSPRSAGNAIGQTVIGLLNRKEDCHAI